MKEIQVNIQGMGLDYKSAQAIADSIASMIDSEPTIVAWHDKLQAKMSPVIEGADINTRWHDYGVAFGGDLNVSINGEYDFIFTDTSACEQGVPSPYMTVYDKSGHEYMCLMGELRDPQNPTEQACIQTDVEPGHYS